MSNKFLIAVGVILSVAVGVIYLTPKADMSGTALDYLPSLNAIINATVALLLLCGLWLIKRKNHQRHKQVMLAAFGLSCLFLLSYVVYHITHESTVYGGQGLMRTIYLSLLLTHIVLAAVVAPLVLITISRGLSAKFDKHRRIARITWPIWFYVSVSGVLVYVLISPYYP